MDFYPDLLTSRKQNEKLLQEKKETEDILFSLCSRIQFMATLADQPCNCNCLKSDFNKLISGDRALEQKWKHHLLEQAKERAEAERQDKQLAERRRQGLEKERAGLVKRLAFVESELGAPSV